jgi:hypothetical protein
MVAAASAAAPLISPQTTVQVQTAMPVRTTRSRATALRSGNPVPSAAATQLQSQELRTEQLRVVPGSSPSRPELANVAPSKAEGARASASSQHRSSTPPTSVSITSKFAAATLEPSPQDRESVPARAASAFSQLSSTSGASNPRTVESALRSAVTLINFTFHFNFSKL